MANVTGTSVLKKKHPGRSGYNTLEGGRGGAERPFAERHGFLRGEGKLQAELGAPRVIAVRPTRGSETRGNALLPSGWAHFPEGPGSLPLASGQLDCTPSASSQGHPKIILVCVSPALQHSHDTRGSKKHHLSSPPQLPRSCRGGVTLSSPPPRLPRPSGGQRLFPTPTS